MDPTDRTDLSQQPETHDDHAVDDVMVGTSRTPPVGDRASHGSAADQAPGDRPDPPAAGTTGTAATMTMPHVPPTGATSAAAEGPVAESVVRESRRPGGRRLRRWVLWLIAVPLIALVVLAAAWAVDDAIAGDSVPRNTELAGRAVGGMDQAELTAVVEDLAADLPDTEVDIRTEDLQLGTTAGELGIGLDAAGTIEVVTGAGTTAPLWQRPFEWAGSFFSPRTAPVELSVDETTMATTIEALEGEDRTAPVEPSLVVNDGVATLSPGVDGIQLDASVVSEALPESLSDVDQAIQVDVERTVVPPRIADEEVSTLVDQANAMAQRTTTVRAGEQSFEVDGSTIIGGASVDTTGEVPALVVSDEVMDEQILAQQSAVANPTDVTFVAGGGGLVPRAGHDAQVCCGEGASALIVDALLTGAAEVEVPTRTMTAAEGVQWASTLGVNQVVSEFTTPHKCCQGRVTNIHTIADRIRGTLIPPGATFSVNDLTGRRTTEKGYVPAPAIVDGKHVPDVGGGVSQFATTLFNAAFFAGLPIPEYKMHSEYISRYPYAREATLFYPSVDLRIRNDTPHGIVIWPTYTDTSISVALWSTPWARGEEIGKSKSSGCGSVTTTRKITYPDGTTAEDSFRANYRCV